MEFIIVTGMSGAGKSAALRFLEDLDFYCVDNLPPQLIPTLVDICHQGSSAIDKLALGIDIRGQEQFDELTAILDGLAYPFKILFLDAKDSVLLKRYKETRRKHPLLSADTTQAIARERERLSEIRSRATNVIDTSFILPKELKERVTDIFLGDKPFSNLSITVLSFGFKHGMPTDTDMMFDVRFIPNPFYVPELREKTGNQPEVQEYVMSHECAVVFLEKLKDMVDYTIPFFIKEDKNQLIVSVGCTGGKHRSVTLANKLYDHLSAQGHNVLIEHRDSELPNRKR